VLRTFEHNFQSVHYQSQLMGATCLNLESWQQYEQEHSDNY